MLSGGNGPPVEPVDRLARVESLLEAIEKSLAVHFTRTRTSRCNWTEPSPTARYRQSANAITSSSAGVRLLLHG
jgi:hypothetical protein